jgi:hypothetical protein
MEQRPPLMAKPTILVGESLLVLVQVPGFMRQPSPCLSLYLSAALGIKSRALHILGKWSTNELYPQPLVFDETSLTM